MAQDEGDNQKLDIFPLASGLVCVASVGRTLIAAGQDENDQEFGHCYKHQIRA
jgi:hypothetical protein